MGILRPAWVFAAALAARGLCACNSKSSDGGTERPVPGTFLGSGIETAPPNTKASCWRIQACLQSLSPDYEPARDSEIRSDVARCFGATTEDWWKAKECVPVQFERDARNGRKIEAYVQCSDVCTPQHTGTGIRYVDVTELECLCLGASPLLFWGIGAYYGGCDPAGGGSPDLNDFALDERAIGDRKEYRVCFGHDFKSLPLVQIPEIRIMSVDGAPVRSAEQLEEVFLRLPEHPPREIRMASTPTDPRGHEIHFIDGSVLASLVHSMNALRVLELPSSRSYAAKPDDVTVYVGGEELSNDLRGHDEKTKRFREFVRQLETAARSVPPDPRTPPPSCRDLRALPVQFQLYRDKHTIDLRYVDWVKPTSVPRPAKRRPCTNVSGRASFTAVTVSGGKIDQADQSMYEMRHDFSRCYRSALTKDPYAEGSISLSVSVGSDGAIRTVTALPLGNLPVSLVSCVKARAREALFGAPRGGPSVVSVRVSF